MRGIGDAGDAIWSVALAWTAVQTTTPALAGLIVAAGSIPRAVALLFGGVLADRLDARRIMLLFNIARTAVVITVAVWCVMTAPTVAVLLGAALLFGLCDAFYDPASGTISRQLARRADLAAYTGAMQTAGRLGGMFGAATGGVLIAQAGLAGSAAVNAGIVIGFGAGFGSVLLGATFAGVTEPRFLGRMGSIIRLGDDSLRPLTTVAFGALATVTALWVPFVVYGGAYTVLIVVLLMNRQIRSLTLREERTR